MQITVNGSVSEDTKAQVWADLIFVYIMNQPAEIRRELYDRFMADEDGGEGE